MKIIKEGLWKLPWSEKYTCKHTPCGAILQVDEGDIFAPDYNTGYGFNCPICGSYNEVPWKEIPERVRSEREKKRKRSSSSDWD